MVGKWKTGRKRGTKASILRNFVRARSVETANRN
ncbi:hypothetical protein CGLAUT_08015 [Corynebacterium glaucum]|nr:hypothetical protein CGLAUT_08015 [Corynebacterium glaucum]